MSTESVSPSILEVQRINSEVNIINPGEISPEITADHLITLLSSMYVEHGITKNRTGLIDQIKSGDVLTWFAQKEGKPIATASLVRSGEAWELGRGVSLERGNGMGKQVMLIAANHHQTHFANTPLIAEVRAATEFAGIPGSQATQKICLQHIGLTPYALAPLFSHGNPKRHEPFILATNQLDSNVSIGQRLAQSLNNRTTTGDVPKVSCVQSEPFRVFMPDNSGKNVDELDDFGPAHCNLFVVEATDQNMPLVGALSANPNMVVCGVDRIVGKEGKPVILIASLDFRQGKDGQSNLLAPAELFSGIPTNHSNDLRDIASKFESIHQNHSVNIK